MKKLSLINDQKQLNQQLVKKLVDTKENFERCKDSFKKEMQIKNGLYYFILSHGLIETLRKYEMNADYQKTDYHQKCIEWLVSNLPDNKK